MKCKSLLSYNPYIYKQKILKLKISCIIFILFIMFVRLNMSLIFTTSPIPIYSLEPFCKCKFLLIMNVCEFPVFNGRKKVVKIRRNKNKDPYECT